MIKKCSCQHQQQDEIHGYMNRVFNVFKSKQGGGNIARCTVCGNTSNA